MFDLSERQFLRNNPGHGNVSCDCGNQLCIENDHDFPYRVDRRGHLF